MIRIHVFVITIGIAMVLGCGAPLKKADEVKHIFSNSQELTEKVTNLCSTLQKRQQSPNLNGVGLASQMCTGAGSKPFNYNDLQNSLGFTTFLRNSSGDNAAVAQSSASLLNIQSRSELWLNRSLLQLAVTLFNGLQSETGEVLGQGGASSSQNKDFDFQIIGKPNFNRETFEFNIEFNLTSTKAQNGLVDINNTFRATGQLFDKKYAAVKAETVGESPKEKSLIKNARILVLVVPHSGDVFMDIATDFDFHSFGVDSVFAQEIEKTLGTGLKAIPDLVAKLEREQGASLVERETGE